MRFNTCSSPVAFLAGMFLCVSSAAAQSDSLSRVSPPFLSMGNRIRVTSTVLEPKRQWGYVTQYQNDTLSLRSETAENTVVTIPIHDVQKIELPTRRRQWRAGLKWGGIVGTAVGIVAGATLNREMATWWCKKDCGEDKAAVRGALVGGAVVGVEGMALGSLIGLLFYRDEWKNVDFPRPNMTTPPSSTIPVRTQEARLSPR